MTTFKKIIALILALVCITSLVACDLGSDKDDEETTEVQTDKKEKKPSGEITFDFISNGDGTCSARMLYADTDDEMELSVEFPATSPDGDKVTTITYCPTTRYGNVPLMVPMEDFDKVIEKIFESAEKSDNSREDTHEAKRCKAYFLLQDPDAVDGTIRDLMFKKYPITKEMSVYTLDESSTPWELERLSKILYTLGDFDMNDRAKAHKATHVEGLAGKHGNVVSATIPEGVTVLGATFGGWDTLKTVSLPASLEKITNAFVECPNITEIKFAGTVEQWNAIEKCNNFFEESPWDEDIESYTVICSDGTVSK